jgi:hypothetical protein
MISGRSVIDRNCPADHFHGDITASTLLRDHSEQMQAVRMSGVDGKNLAIDALSFGQPSRPVVPKSIPQHVLDDPRRLPCCSFVVRFH